MTTRTSTLPGTQSPASPSRAEAADSMYVPGTRVLGTDGQIGTLAGVRVDRATNRPRLLLVRQPRFFGLLGTTRLVPADAVLRMGDGEIVLAMARKDVSALPVAHGDRHIQHDAWQAIREEVHARLFRRAIRVTVQDGVVTLEGATRAPATSRRLERAVAAVPGVVAVENHLHDDETLTHRVAAALAQDPAIRRAHLRVASRLGEVSLAGTLPSAAESETATELAAAVAGVARVHNGIMVRAPRSRATISQRE